MAMIHCTVSRRHVLIFQQPAEEIVLLINSLLCFPFL